MANLRIRSFVDYLCSVCNLLHFGWLGFRQRHILGRVLERHVRSYPIQLWSCHGDTIVAGRKKGERQCDQGRLRVNNDFVDSLRRGRTPRGIGDSKY